MTHTPTRIPPAAAKDGDYWPEILPCGGRVVWQYVADTVEGQASADLS